MDLSSSSSSFSNGSDNGRRLSRPKPPSESKFQRNSTWIHDEIIREDSKVFQYQKEAVLKTKELFDKDWDDHKRNTNSENNFRAKPALIVAPTGSGKTGIITLLPYILESRKVLVLTPSKVITQQIAVAFGLRPDKPSFFEVSKIEEDKKELKTLLEPPRIITKSAEIREALGDLVIVNAQRFAGRSGASLNLEYKEAVVVNDAKAFFMQFDTLIVDEAHHYPASTWEMIVDAFCFPVDGMQKKLIFVTATPNRGTADGHEGFILQNWGRDRIAFDIKVETLKGTVIRDVEFSDEKQSATDFAEDLSNLMDAQQQSEPRFDHQAMVIVRRKDEADEYADMLNSYNHNPKFAIAVHGSSQRAMNLVDAFTRGEYKVAVVCQLLNEGYNNPKVSVCVILRKIASRILFSQFIGRAMRMNLGIDGDKTKGKILSYKQFGQRKLWEKRNVVAEEDPEYEIGEDVIEPIL